MVNVVEHVLGDPGACALHGNACSGGTTNEDGLYISVVMRPHLQMLGILVKNGISGGKRKKASHGMITGMSQKRGLVRVY